MWAAKVRKPAKKASIMTVLPPSNTNLDKAPVEITQISYVQYYPRRCPNDTCHDCQQYCTVITPSCAQAACFNPYERPNQFSEFEAKYGIVCSGITSLANDAGVNTKEALPSARHKSVAVQHPYMMRNQDSEMAKF